MGLASKLAASQGGAVPPQGGGAPPQQQQPGGYPPPQQQQPGGYPPPQQQHPGGYPPPQQQQPGGYPPPQQQGGYPPQPPPRPAGYGGQHPQQQGGYPPQGGGYPGQQPPPGRYNQPPPPIPGQHPGGGGGYPQGGGYPPQRGQQPMPYPPQQQQGGYPPQHQQHGGYPPQQQQPGGYPPQQQRPQQGGGPNAQNYMQLLQRAVQENQLEAFYPPQRLQQLAGAIGPQVDQLVQQWQIPMELGVDLVRLALYDVVLFVDDSGSMSFEENGERIDDLKLILQRTAYAASLFDTDGIEVRFFNNEINGNNIRTNEQAFQLVSQVKFHGLTPLGTSMRKKILDPMVLGPAKAGQMQKPVLVITITDGHPSGENSSTIFKVIKETKQKLASSRFGPGAVAFQFAQVGNDLKAREFLGKLDTDREVGAMVDCTSNFEVEQDEMARLGADLTPSSWIVKLLMGAIDRSYDEQDEGPRR